MISTLYEKIQDNKDFKNIIEKISEKFCVNPNEEALILLYSYDYLHITHRCISDFLEKNETNEENINKLKSLIV
jgi:hypothetical protein